MPTNSDEVMGELKVYKEPQSSASELSGLLDCPAGHIAETWLVGGWVMCGCKSCNHAAAAYKSFEQASHDWNAMCKVMMAN